MATEVKLYSDNKRKQYRMQIPKRVVEFMGFQHMDKFELEWDKENNKMILKKVGNIKKDIIDDIS